MTMDNQRGNGQTVCVTGAGGFIASWLVKLLLERGYTVRGTVRKPEDEKNAHLKHLEGAEERLILVQMVEPAVNGTKNVLDASAQAGVRRVGRMGCGQANWYCYGKTVAEQAAWERAKEKELDLVVVNPCVVLGPLLQSAINASTLHILKYLTGSAKTYANSVQAYVHVRDVAEAHILVFENTSASGRYLCAESVLHRGDVVDLLTKMFPQYPIPNRCSDEVKPRMKPYAFSNQKLKDVGLEFTPVKQCLYETV
ncbi:hypothetical protein KI387_008303, partial [Taxus chinensis]